MIISFSPWNKLMMIHWVCFLGEEGVISRHLFRRGINHRINSPCLRSGECSADWLTLWDSWLRWESISVTWRRPIFLWSRNLILSIRGLTLRYTWLIWEEHSVLSSTLLRIIQKQLVHSTSINNLLQIITFKRRESNNKVKYPNMRSTL